MSRPTFSAKFEKHSDIFANFLTIPKRERSETLPKKRAREREEEEKEKTVSWLK